MWKKCATRANLSLNISHVPSESSSPWAGGGDKAEMDQHTEHVTEWKGHDMVGKHMD